MTALLDYRTAKKAAAAKKRQGKEIDRLVEAAYYRTCSGVQVNIMDIPAIFRAGREAILAGADKAGLEAAIVAFVAKIRKN